MAKHVLVYPGHGPDPEDLLNFSELDWFARNWRDLGLGVEDELAHLQITIMAEPRAGDTVTGTGGLRKLRYTPPGRHEGKSGSLRVCYVYFEKYGWVALVTVYKKGDLDDISARGKSAIKKAIQRIEKSLEKRFGF
jgi:hypothetical protein